MLTFGVTVLPDPPYTRLLELVQMAEEHGFDNAWTYDSHILWHESYPLLAMGADRTKTIKFGHCVTNPGIREPTITASYYATLHEVSNGRAVMGIGRGDSSRRVVGPEAGPGGRVRALAPDDQGPDERPPRRWNGKELQLQWVRKELPPIEMYVAGYGPKALAVAGRVGDGVIIQLADPEIIGWIMDTARKAAEEEGRDPAALKCHVCAPSHISDDIADARNQVRWFGAWSRTTSWT